MSRTLTPDDSDALAALAESAASARDLATRFGWLDSFGAPDTGRGCRGLEGLIHAGLASEVGPLTGDRVAITGTGCEWLVRARAVEGGR